MLTASAGFADLEQLSIVALGSVTLHGRSPVALGELLDIYSSSFVAQGSGIVADIPDEALQIALGTEVEAAVDRCVRQVATYERLLNIGGDALWTAVTGYYAAFFAGNALMLAAGRGLARVSPSKITAATLGGLHSVSVGQGSTSGHLRLELTPIKGPKSHQTSWSAVRDLTTQLAGTTGNGAREAQTFAALSGLIVGPPWLSQSRNDINYDFHRNPFLATYWNRQLNALTDEDAIADRVLQITNPRPEQRFELVLASCASLVVALSYRFKERGGKRDPHRAERRRRALDGSPHLQWLFA